MFGIDRYTGGGGVPYETFRSIIDNKKNVSPILINIGIMLINIINNHVLNYNFVYIKNSFLYV